MLHVERIQLMATKIEYPIVEVFWHDAYSTDTWDDIDTHAAAESFLVRSVGFLVKHGKDHLVLVTSLAESDLKAATSLIIPLPMIQSWHVLELE